MQEARYPVLASVETTPRGTNVHPLRAVSNGTNLRHLRIASSRTQRALAEMVGASPLMIRRYEHGKELIPPGLQGPLAAVFSVSVSFLMGWY